MTEQRGTKKPTGGAFGNHSSARKRAVIQPAQDDNAFKRLSTALLDGREQQLKREREAFEEERRLITAALDERQGELDKRDRLSREKGAAAEKTRNPAEVACMKVGL